MRPDLFEIAQFLDSLTNEEAKQFSKLINSYSKGVGCTLYEAYQMIRPAFDKVRIKRNAWPPAWLKWSN